MSLKSRSFFFFFPPFHDGSYALKGAKGLEKELKNPLSVAFGSSYDSVVVFFVDGSWEYSENKRLAGRITKNH